MLNIYHNFLCTLWENNIILDLTVGQIRWQHNGLSNIWADLILSQLLLIFLTGQHFFNNCIIEQILMANGISCISVFLVTKKVILATKLIIG